MCLTTFAFVNFHSSNTISSLALYCFALILLCHLFLGLRQDLMGESSLMLSNTNGHKYFLEDECESPRSYLLLSLLFLLRVSWSVMHVCRECSWLSEFTTESKGSGFLMDLHTTTSILLWIHLVETAGLPFPGREETADCPWVLSLYYQGVSCSQGPSGKEHRKSVMKHVLYTIPIEPQEKNLLPVSVMKHDTRSLCIQIQLCHAFLHLLEEQHVPMDKPLKHFLICLGNRDRKATPGRPMRNRTMATWTQTRSGL